jgi:hypothetical protein
MQTVKNLKTLNQNIETLERQQVEEWGVLTQQFNHSFDQLQPINLIKSALADFTHDADIKNELIALTSGYITKKLYVGTSEDSIKNIVGLSLQFLVTTLSNQFIAPFKAEQHEK